MAGNLLQFNTSKSFTLVVREPLNTYSSMAYTHVYKDGKLLWLCVRYSPHSELRIRSKTM